ncbi:hypothetical protein ACV1MP_032890 [Pseudomonas aeruginosa]
MKANLKQTALVLVLGAVAASAAVPAFAAEGDLDFSSMISSVNGSAVIAAFMAMGVVKLGPTSPAGLSTRWPASSVAKFLPALPGVPSGAPFCFSFPCPGPSVLATAGPGQGIPTSFRAGES